MVVVEPRIGYERLLDAMTEWGISMCSGVTGGGLVHLLKQMDPYVPHRARTEQIEFFTVGEYVAGFVPLGHYLATGKIAAAAATTGAASKLLLCGLSDAKLHNIPAVYLIAATPSSMAFQSPLQDTTESGSNMIGQLMAELPEGTFVLDDIASLDEQLSAAWDQLNQSKPVALVMPPDALSEMTSHSSEKGMTLSHRDEVGHESLTALFQRHLSQRRTGRIVVMAGDEAARYPDMLYLTSRLCEVLKAPIVWSINGANAVSRDNPYAHGYLGFGGNDRATELWDSLNERDMLITIGFCADEYTANFSPAKAGLVWNITANAHLYGSAHGSFRHQVVGEFLQTVGDVEEILRETILWCQAHPQVCNEDSPRYSDLNVGTCGRVHGNAVDIVAFYEKLDGLWQPDSLGFDDVCLAYKDRQYVTQRPHPHAKIYSLYRGSAMGGAYGLGLGAKIASPGKHVFVFSGDGCFRLYGGCLVEARQLGITLFVLDNANYGIVEQGLSKILPHTPARRYHGELERIDFCAMARACGWLSVRVSPDLSNLSDIMREAYRRDRPSMLVEVPVDSHQVVGPNPRLKNL
ncbi:thiamine pyrophosphate-dependent enzyme [Dyella acidisoli]|uniref:Acetolactate synthase n=1 Tax=Dyella acidisoli TaxID=1867834 RepID=A0ABQ5XQQ9_9GAMM|nr:thiamine pyrophosphate-dependent enzyme [Dyella acidisoli]GLQ92835.1 acetolactate synthase [Dyella acidisoli]